MYLYNISMFFICLIFLNAGFIESSPCVEKIKVFEKYFSSKIHLYNKVPPSACMDDILLIT